ncbi:MAG: isoleucine--tRNA ligase [Candidatus Spechtbacterales bacterium]
MELPKQACLPVGKQARLPARQEERILKFWKSIRAFEKSVSRRPKGRQFVFYEGPPTANGKPGIHHVLSRAYKDIICRYKTMRGYRVERKAGWDTHGLPVEIEVEKELGLKNKKDIETYGIAKFNEKCRQSVWRYKQEWDSLTERIAFWLDLKGPYITYDAKYMEALWEIIKQAHKKGLLYEGHRVAPYCPRCGTSISSHEVALGYENVTEDSVYVKFEIKNPITYNLKPKTLLLAWTTTPWTLPGNVALAVGEKIDYVLVGQGDEHHILAKDRLNILDGEYKIVKEFKGKELEGVEYEPLFDSLKSTKEKKHYVALADFVSTKEGTGIVHTAVMYGEDDYNLGQKLSLPKVHTVDQNGRFNELVPQWQGKFVKDTEPAIIADLKTRNLLYKKETYTHSYPFCWRCKTPLLYYAMQSWFIKMSVLRDKLIKNNNAVNWVPAHIKEGRFGEWLREVKDWNFSRNRYWGTPLPIWRCQMCDSIKVVGSIKELGKQVPRNTKKEIDLHRPYVDKVILSCGSKKCAGKMKREEALADVWFDSGAMPFASKPAGFPADYISEAIDQTRGWFYTLLAISTVLGREAPYKNVISLGHVLDKNGKKMSKSVGNVIDPWSMIEKYGSDALRWHFYTVNQPGDYKRFDETELQKTYRKFISTLYNTLIFYKTYRNDKSLPPLTPPSNILDKWILSKLHNLIGGVLKSLDAYDITGAARAIESFTIDDLSNWYVRRSRRRFQTPEASEEKEAAEQVLGYVLLELSKVCAPFVPFLSEEIYQQLSPEGGQVTRSVHWEDFPKANKKFIRKDLEKEMEQGRGIVEKAHQLRSSAGIRVRQPLLSLEVDMNLSKEILNIIAEEVNVKKVIEGKNVSLDVKLTLELKEEGFINEFIRHAQDLRKVAGFMPKDRIVLRYSADVDLSASIQRWVSRIQTQNNAQQILEAKGEDEAFKAQGEFEWDGKKVWVGIKKI